MRAAMLHALGEAPRCEEFPEPTASAGQVVVQVLGAALKSVDKQMASGAHYASAQEFPVTCGTDGVGRLDDGRRVFFGVRPPYGTMAERTVIHPRFAFPVPDTLDDATAAAIPNPGVSAWLTLSARAKLKPGDNVLILGGTGVTGKLAIRIARLLGAARVVAAGRNRTVLDTLGEYGADATITLDLPAKDLTEALARAVGETGFQVVVDYVWGPPAEAFFAAITRREFADAAYETRYVQVGESAGSNVSLAAAVLRSTPLSIMGTAGIPPMEVLIDAMEKVMQHAASGELRIDTECVPLAEIEVAWKRDTRGRRIVIVP
jgi:NADPH:quinone reductase-like Zn-dependent oxidoreductase